MRTLKLRASEGRPFILVDFINGRLEMSGNVNAPYLSDHFLPIVTALQIHDFKGEKIELHFFLDEINTEGGNEIIRLLNEIKKKKMKGHNVLFYWYVTNSDDLLLGRSLGELTGLKTILEPLEDADELELNIGLNS